MSRQINRAETYEKIHQGFAQINFNAFDYITVKRSLVTYLQTYYPEDFNDFIESSELIAIIETFAYVCELISYRLDMNAQENFLSTAQRRESILRIAKLVSYRPTRNIPHRGLVRITSVLTTENTLDIDGINLANIPIQWNDNNNPKWKDQFLLVMNRVLSQRFGTVGADNRTQVDNVLLELYTLNNVATSTTSRTFPYSVSVSDRVLPMELVPTQLTAEGPVEKRPETNGAFTIMFGSDGLGDASDTTGFLAFTKQGLLQKREISFDGITPNQTFDINVADINNTDVYINNVNSDDRTLLVNDPSETLFSTDNEARFGEWFEVGSEDYESVIFNTETSRRKFEVETLDNDEIRIIFGDGEFADIPNGSFDIWFRTSDNDNVTIPKSAVSNETASFTYLDENGSTQTFTFTFSLVNALQNSSASESIEHIRTTAPSVYYTQDRMVNARDYNTFLLQDPRILKLKAINRTFAGDSKYIAWHDPKEYYEDTKLFGNDLAIFRRTESPANGLTTSVNTPVNADILIENFLEPLLSSIDYFLMVGTQLELRSPTSNTYRVVFSDNDANPEKTLIRTALESAVSSSNSVGSIGNGVSLYYSVALDRWFVNQFDRDYLLVFQITPVFTSGNIQSGWRINQATDSLVAYSDTTRFWHENGPDTQLNLNSLLAVEDTLTVLAANTTAEGTGIIGRDIKFNVVRQESLNDTFDTINSLNILPVDLNQDEIPDDLLQTDLFGAYAQFTPVAITDPDANGFGLPILETVNNIPFALELPISYLQGFEDNDVEIYVTRANGDIQRLYYIDDWSTPPLGTPLNSLSGTIIRSWIQINPSSVEVGDVYSIRARQYVYLQRDTINDPWVVVPDNESTRLLFFQEQTSADSQRRYTRYEGRYPMNFSWFHSTPRLNLIDPAPSNIIDMFIITDSYYRDFVAYLNGVVSFVPAQPSSNQLGQTFRELLRSKMISDTVIIHSGNIRPLFGPLSAPEDQAMIKVILSQQNTFSDSDIKNQIINVVRRFFDINNWNFGETFYFSELSAAIHAELNASIQSVVLVPTGNGQQFGDLYQIQAREDEIFSPNISASEITIIQTLTPDNLKQ